MASTGAWEFPCHLGALFPEEVTPLWSQAAGEGEPAKYALASAPPALRSCFHFQQVQARRPLPVRLLPPAVPPRGLGPGDRRGMEGVLWTEGPRYPVEQDGGGQSVAWILTAKQPVPYRVQRLIGKGTAKGAGSQLYPAI